MTTTTRIGKWGGFGFSNNYNFSLERYEYKTSKYAPVEPAAMPRVQERALRLERAGYVLRPDMSTAVIQATRTLVRANAYAPVEARSTSVGMRGALVFESGDAQIRFELKGHGTHVPELLQHAARLRAHTVRYTGPILEGGQGQMKQALEIATRLATTHRDEIDEDTWIEVNVWTRSGRGGWKIKVATRRWDAEELWNPKPKAKRVASARLEAVTA